MTSDFESKYRHLESRMRELAEADSDIFTPSPRPAGPVQYILICMEPSLGRNPQRSPTRREMQREVQGNFLNSMEDFILHFAARNYLCAPGEGYHVTDWSKGAMLVNHANVDRHERYDRWYPLLVEEIDLVGFSGAGIVAVGSEVAKHLERKEFNRPFHHVIHYSGQAGRARKAGIVGHEPEFEVFRDAVSLDDLVANAETVMRSAGLPPLRREETLARLANKQLTLSRQRLLFIYKMKFESIPGE